MTTMTNSLYYGCGTAVASVEALCGLAGCVKAQPSGACSALAPRLNRPGMLSLKSV